MDKDAIVDIRKIKLSSNANVAEKAQKFFKDIKNPYLFRVDDIVVHVEFGNRTSESLQSHIQNLLSAIG